MSMKIARALGAIGLVYILAASATLAQQPQTARIRGTIEKVDGHALTVKARDGAEIKVKLTDNPRIMALIKASLSDIKPGTYIGVTALPQADGAQRAIAIHIFTEAQRGTGEGHRPWDLQPNSTMTNAAVDTIVAGVDGEAVTVKYRGGEKKVIVSSDTPIVAFASGAASDVKPGAHVIIFSAARQADGTLQASAITVGRDGVIPPM